MEQLKLEKSKADIGGKLMKMTPTLENLELTLVDIEQRLTALGWKG